ncbi:serine protease [Polyangium aurulentum]|uniref:serine protease n=1 Tax=Polyangium aurulentum TaxID=2567896 RepID=UPI0010AE6E5F|nr:serine protease [Polyangium aurulentum]UQA58833.1 serine protease [Polyangium aurulentum]
MVLPVRALGLLAVLVAGCGASEAGSDKAKAPASPPKPAPAGEAAASAPKTPPDRLRREDLKTVLPSGLPWLLRRVWPEEVFRDGKFVGWRLVAIPEEWTGLDLRPEDIVTRVNGKPLETPEQVWEAWTSLATATELRVAYDRNGQARELLLPIEGPPAPELLASLTNPSPPPRKAQPRKGTIVIEGRDPAGDGASDE